MSRQLENISLLLAYESPAMPLWMERWAYSYPTVGICSVSVSHELSGSLKIQTWQHQIAQTFQQFPPEDQIFIVAHGTAANAVIAWYYQTDIGTQKRIAGIMLVSPNAQDFPDDNEHTFQRVRFNQATALVIGQNDPQSPKNWAHDYAQLTRARLLIAPQTGHLNGALDGWQWGMKLMQEMLLSD
ncbi:alpha/beta hydrolase [Neisseriaceae bacterium B1]